MARGEANEQTVVAHALRPRSAARGIGLAIPQDEQNIRNWIRRQPSDMPFGDVVNAWMSKTWLEEREVFMQQLNGIESVDIAVWVVREYGLDKITLTEGSMRKFLGGSLRTYGRVARQAESNLTMEERNLIKRLYSYAHDRRLDFFEMVDAARNDVLIASALQKNPTKQGHHEPLASSFIEKYSGYPTVQLASEGSVLPLRFSKEGEVFITQDATIEDTKSTDILTVVPTKKGAIGVIASHKFARTRGGHQSNQLKDAFSFMDGAMAAGGRHIPELTELAGKIIRQPLTKKNFLWVPALVLDGQYFHKTLNELDPQDLEKYQDHFIGNSDDFIHYLKKLP